MALTKVKAGNILLTTPAASSNDVTPATTAYVTTAIANLADSAPSTLNTLNELAAALGDDANFSTTVTNSIAAKLPLAGGTLTGHLKGTTFGTNLTTTVGVGGTPADSNTAELGPGYLNLARDDTADAKQLLFGKNGAVHSFIETTSSGLNIGGASVGIGETSPQGNLHVKSGDSGATADSGANELVVEGSSNAGISILSGASASGSIYFGDSGSAYDGYIQYDQTNRKFNIITAAGGGGFHIDSVGNAKLSGGNNNEVYMDIFSDSGSNRGAGYFRFLTDGGSAEESVAQIYMEQGAGDGGSRKCNMYFQVSDNGAPSTAITIENNKNVTFHQNDSTVVIGDGGTNAAIVKASTGDELYVGGDNNDGYFRIKSDGNTQVMSPSNFWVNLAGSDRYGFDSVRIYPGATNTYDLGISSHRWRYVYGVNSNFSSDARLKTELTQLTDNEIEASKLLAKEIGTYKWLDQVASEGDKAKINIGLTAQKIIEIMESCSLNALDYQLVTFSEWDATEAKIEKRMGEDGKVEEYTIPATPKGDEYGVCYEQLNQFIAAGFNARLTALEG